MTSKFLQISLSTWQGFCVSQAHEQPSLPSSVKVPSVRLKPGTEDVKQLVLEKSNCQGKSLGSRFERFERFTNPTFGTGPVRWWICFFFAGAGWEFPVLKKNYSKISVHQNFACELEANRSTSKKGGKCFRHATKNIQKKSYTMGLPPGGGSLLPCRRGAGGLSESNKLDFGKSPKGYRVTFQRSFPPSKSPVH